jgi:molybdopterin synthase catalytic subunit
MVRDAGQDRTVTALYYEAYPDAERFLRECCEYIARRPSGRGHPPTGALLVGDIALAAAVAAPRRTGPRPLPPAGISSSRSN